VVLSNLSGQFHCSLSATKLEGIEHFSDFIAAITFNTQAALLALSYQVVIVEVV